MEPEGAPLRPTQSWVSRSYSAKSTAKEPSPLKPTKSWVKHGPAALETVQEAKLFFNQVVLPRRVRDRQAEEAYFLKRGVRVRRYRKLGPDEEERGEPFPVWSAGLKTFAHFGLSIYFLQLLVLCGCCLVGGLIMIWAMVEYRKSSYGLQNDPNPLVAISAACAPLVSVLATVGCSDEAAQCEAFLRPHCELPKNAALADLIMSAVILAAVWGSLLFEEEVERQMDEMLQTTQDYSVCVNDPGADADDPDEWKRYFGRFGQVQYVTVTKANSSLTRIITRKHKLVLRMLEGGSGKGGSLLEGEVGGKATDAEALRLVDAQLEEALSRDYPVCRVYVIFETEMEQRRCLRELEVPDYQAFLDSGGDKELLFRGTNVLDVVEPPEPDSVLWENLELDMWEKAKHVAAANLIALALLFALYWIVEGATAGGPLVLGAVVAGADSLLMFAFSGLSNLNRPTSEGLRQSDLQVKLFIARLLTSTIFPFLQAPWDGVLDAERITAVLAVQFSACFVLPLVFLLDFPGLFSRHVLVRLSDTQGEANSMWLGSDWSLAERYTGAANILFVSLFYALLSPVSLLLAFAAFALVFFVDRFLLLRRWARACAMGADIARRLRQQGILAVALHMIVTLRFIYSWPMDSAYMHEDGSYELVDKQPSLAFWSIVRRQWMAQGQADVLVLYGAFTIASACIALYVWVLDPLLLLCRRLFLEQHASVGDVSEAPFSSLEEASAYVPVTSSRQSYHCCHLEKVLPRNLPSLIRTSHRDFDDLSVYVPADLRAQLLSRVKYYGSDLEQEIQAKRGVGMDKQGGQGEQGEVSLNSAPLVREPGLLEGEQGQPLGAGEGEGEGEAFASPAKIKPSAGNSPLVDFNTKIRPLDDLPMQGMRFGDSVELPERRLSNTSEGPPPASNKVKLKPLS